MNAKIFFGSTEAITDTQIERKSPYSGDVVSTAPICSVDDANKALKIAQDAAADAKASTLAQRCSWLLDVAKKA